NVGAYGRAELVVTYWVRSVCTEKLGSTSSCSWGDGRRLMPAFAENEDMLCRPPATRVTPPLKLTFFRLSELKLSPVVSVLGCSITGPPRVAVWLKRSGTQVTFRLAPQ